MFTFTRYFLLYRWLCVQKIYKLRQTNLSQFVYFSLIMREREETKTKYSAPKEKNLIDGMTPKQHRIWEVNQKKRLDLMEIETGTLKEVNGKILIEIWQEIIILIIINLVFQKRVLELTSLCNEQQIEIALLIIWHHARVLKCTQGLKV